MLNIYLLVIFHFYDSKLNNFGFKTIGLPKEGS